MGQFLANQQQKRQQKQYDELTKGLYEEYVNLQDRIYENMKFLKDTASTVNELAEQSNKIKDSVESSEIKNRDIQYQLKKMMEKMKSIESYANVLEMKLKNMVDWNQAIELKRVNLTSFSKNIKEEGGNNE